MRFVGRVGSGHTIVMDNGQGDTGARPAELVALAVAGCTAMDVISILRKKRQEVTAYEVVSNGTQIDEHPHAFTRIDVTHIVEGPDLDVEAVRARSSCRRPSTARSARRSPAVSPRSTMRTSYATARAGARAEVVVLGPTGSARRPRDGG